MSISLPTHITISPDVLFQGLEGESVLLHLESERYYGLDDVGTRIWELLDEHSDTATVLERLLAEYDADEATLRQDLADLIAKLVAVGMVVVERQTSEDVKED